MNRLLIDQMKVATISLNIAWQDIAKNLERAEKFVLQAKADGSM
jgi:predicted amidohydrolase